MNILIIEDDILLASQIAKTFYGRIITQRVDIVTSLHEFRGKSHLLHRYDIVLVDLRLSPGTSCSLDGYAIIEYIHHAIMSLPIIVISGVDDIDVLRRAFQIGAIDYIMKPFRLAELEVRIEHWFSSFYLDKILEQNPIDTLDFHYDLRCNEFYKGVDKIPLSRMSKYLLSIFFTHRGSILSHDFLREKIWGDRDTSRERNIRVAILRLRRSLELFSIDRWIHTLPGEGYIFYPE